MLKNKELKIVEKFKMFICIALVVVLLGGVFMLVRVLGGGNVMNFGIDFTGGAVIDLDLSTYARDAEVQKVIKTEVGNILANNEYGLRVEGEMTTTNSTEGVTFEWRIANQYKGATVNDNTSEEFINFVKIDLSNEITEKINELVEGKEGVAANATFVAAGATLPDTNEKFVTAYIVGPSATGGASYKFEGNKATYTWTIGPITYTSVSTYSMGKDEDGKETITFTKTSESKDGDTTRYDTALSFNKGKDNNGEYIEIGGTKYYKK